MTDDATTPVPHPANPAGASAVPPYAARTDSRGAAPPFAEAIREPGGPPAPVDRGGPAPVLMAITGFLAGLLLGLGIAYAAWHAAAN